MTRKFGLLAAGCCLSAVLGGAWQQPPESKPPAGPAGEPSQEQQYEEPPEEDRALTPSRQYVFNPLQAEKEFKVGLFYSRKGSHKAAAMRFEEATRWNPQFGEAYLRLAEAREKLKLYDEARDAYRKYLEVEPEGKRAAEVRARLARLGKK